MPRINNMDVFLDTDDETVISSTTTTITTISYEPEIVIHEPRETPGRLANSMSLSDSDSDFDDSSQQSNTARNKIKKVRTPPKRKLKQSRCISKARTIDLSQKKVSKSETSSNKSQKNNTSSQSQSMTENIEANTPKKNSVNIISAESVKVAVKSAQQKINKSKKKSVAKNIFGADKDTQINTTGTVSSSSVSAQKNVEIQTDFPAKVLKRPLNISTQTNIQDICSDYGNKAKRNLVPMQVSPPKRNKTFHDDCPLMRLIDEHQSKIEEARMNLTHLFTGFTPNSSKIFDSYRDSSTKKSDTTMENTFAKTPLKQLTMSSFVSSTPQKSAIKTSQNVSSTPEKSAPIKTSQNVTPKKSMSKETTPNCTPKKSPSKSPNKEKKESTRYTQESHNRVYENVKNIIEWVFENENFSILFTKTETKLLEKLFKLSDQRFTIVCLRLFTRQNKWYNLLNLCEELNLRYHGFNLKEMYHTLTADFVDGDYSNERTELLLNYLTLPDIKDICKAFKIRAYQNKQNMVNKLLEYATKQCTLTSLKRSDEVLRDIIKKKLGICVKLKKDVKNILFRVHLLYSFTNPDLQNPNDIYNLIYKIRNEVITLPKVTIDSFELFSGRRDFLTFAEARILRTEYEEQILKKDIACQYTLCVEAFNRLKNLLSDENQIQTDKKKPLFLRRFSAAWVYCKVLNTGSQNLGKQHSQEVCEWLTEMLKQEVYCTRYRGFWYHQLALVTKAHRKDITGEAQTLIKGLSDKFVNEVQKREMSIRASKIRKGKLSQMLFDELQCLLLPEIDVPVSRTIRANIVHNNEPGRKLLYVRNTNEGKEYSSVEQTAIDYYISKENYEFGVHCEGQLLDTLFTIFFYDILYNVHIPNTFLTEIQNKPLDLFSGEFFLNRSTKIKSRLINIREKWSIDEICEFALKIFSDYNTQLKSLHNFDLISEEIYQTVIKCIGQKLLAAILERFARDYKQFHSGLPDLFLWNSKELKCCFVEVKSENDKLSTKQILWINYLHSFDAKVEVCHVEHIGSSSTKKIKKSKADKKE